jgi:CBS domain-containing protein
MRTVKDVMLLLDDVPTVPPEATLADAARALREADENRPADRPPYRAVLVVDARGQVLGKLGQLGFLRALEPGWEAPADRATLDRAGIDPGLLDSIAEHQRFWQEGVLACCHRAAHRRVTDVLLEATETIPEDTSLQQAIATMSRLGRLSLLVRRGSEIVGLLRLSDLFEVVSDQLITSSDVNHGE